MTANTLKNYSCKDLAEMARKRGVPGWHGMRKEQLVKALLRIVPKSKSNHSKSPSGKVVAATRRAPATNGHVSRPASSANLRPAAKNRLSMNGSANGASSNGASSNGHASNGVAKPALRPAVANNHATTKLAPPSAAPLAKPMLPKAVAPAKPAKPLPPPEKPKDSPTAKRLQRAQAKTVGLKNLAGRSTNGKSSGQQKDRLVVMVRDPYWLHAHWEITRQSVERAQAALGQDWHSAKPILRLLEVSSGGTTSASAMPVRDIEVHGGVNNWYVDVQDPPKSYRLDIGYRSSNGKFYSLARSNVVSTPKAGVKDALDENWTDVAEDYERIYAMSGGYRGDGGSGELQELFEERLRRPMGSSLGSNVTPAIEGLLHRKKDFHFDIDAELIVYGTTEPDAHVVLQGDPVKLRPDGSFTVRFSMPNCRQVIPAVASSSNGLEQRTIVLAVERNTKVMEPLVRDSSDT